MNVKEHLTVARALIAEENKWTQGTFAREAGGEPTASTSENAVCFCSLGALRRAGRGDTYHRSIAALERFVPAADSKDLATFNDYHSHAEVLDLFDTAIESCTE